jgi:hypothetical protein
VPEAKKLFGVLAQLFGNECAEVDGRMVRDRPRRHPDDGHAGDENASSKQR